jgi:hypothetical protein
MQRITFLFLALVTGLCLQPLPLFAQDQDINGNKSKDAVAATHAVREKPKAAAAQLGKGNPQRQIARSDQSQARINAVKTATDIRSTNTENSRMTTRNIQQSTTVSIQGNRSNQYNGQWVAGNTHNDWDRSINHQWNNQNYRWYDGGWLIINAGPSPGYYQTGSIVIRVKQSLAQQGYYNGHFTQTIGPHTRQAISNYESDKGLQVNGQIDEPLLVSLGLN